jgi:hypothetical protein
MPYWLNWFLRRFTKDVLNPVTLRRARLASNAGQLWLRHNLPGLCSAPFRAGRSLTVISLAPAAGFRLSR